MMNCFCCSGKEYNNCCESIIDNLSATTALDLMRSRYSAYCIEDADYLYKTNYSKINTEISKDEIEKWAKENTWTKLEIIEINDGGVNDTKGVVEFKAYFINKNGVPHIHHEKSTFLKEKGDWLYLDGIVNPQKIVLSTKISRNDLCPCGSGKKYKNCCA